MEEPKLKFYVVTDGDDRTRIIEGETDQDIHEEIELYMEDYGRDIECLRVFELGKERALAVQFNIADLDDM